jgi:hypothetical protein
MLESVSTRTASVQEEVHQSVVLVEEQTLSTVNGTGLVDGASKSTPEVAPPVELTLRRRIIIFVG